ncbi:putative NADH:flavin oxidoreductase/NADH oxidase, aldolase-type TIM barrel [Septoria linicola]|nr:putative NADH:flavin oxidoreductase/NADH oxidase, aldolase-type TIM barrel [Septoria linicola]
MEYDKAVTCGEPESKAYPHDSKSVRGNDGKLRVAGPDVNTSVLRENIKFPFSGRTAMNRFLKAPMTQRLCHWNKPDEPISKRGYPSPEYEHLYRRWGEGEIGMIVAGNLMLKYDAVEAFGNPILQHDHDGRVEAFRKHPGRQGGAALNPNPVSASDVQLTITWAGNWFNKPRALSIPEIKDIVKAWAQFLATTTNKRTDEYGGSLENRSRIIFEIIEEVQRRVNDPRFIICVKLNSVEFQPGGQTPEDCRNLCVKLEEAKVDFIDLSGGTFEGRAFEHKKESTKGQRVTKVYVTGGFRTTSRMVRAIEDEACDGIGIGRPLGAKPYLCKEILAGRITGAIENCVPLPKNTQATGMQLHQIGNGDELISDWSEESEVQRWLEADKEEEKRKMDLLPIVDSSGYAPIRAEAGFAYVR